MYRMLPVRPEAGQAKSHRLRQGEKSGGERRFDPQSDRLRLPGL